MDSDIRNEDHLDETGSSRRDFLKKAGVAAGATAWAVPTLQVIKMAGAGATDHVGGSVPVTMPPKKTNISYIGLNVVCDDKAYTIKWEANGDGTGGSWEDEPGNFPSCDLVVVGTKANGAALGFSATITATGVMIGIPDDCTVTAAQAKGGQNCSASQSGGPGGYLAFPNF